MVETGDHKIVLGERVASMARLDGVAGQDRKVEAELLGELVLPLGDQASGSDDQTAGHVGTQQQLLDVKPGHDRLSCPGVIGEHKAQRLAGEQFAVDGPDLVRERLHQGQMHREQRVEQVRQADPPSLRDQGEQLAVGIEPEARTCATDLEGCLVGAVEETLTDPAVGVTVGEGDR